MKNLAELLLAMSLVLSPGPLFAQKTLSKSIELHFEQSTGTNGSVVAYHPNIGMYYAAIAGNEVFPLEVFNEHGINMKQAKTGFDARGIWYNTKTKRMEGNAQGGGIYEIDLDESGNPSAATKLSDKQMQPGEQSVGTFDSKKKLIVFYEAGYLHFFDSKKYSVKKTLRLKVKVGLDNINLTSLIYTGIKGQEFGLLDHNMKQVLVFNRKGEQTGSYQLPRNAITHTAFRFSYANNLVFLYDVNTRTWVGYSGLN